jgi:hypothetical protein
MVAFIQAFLISAGYASFVFLVNIASIAGVIFLIDKMPYWGITYTLGWVVGLFYIGPKLMDWWEVPVYVAAGLFFLYIKFQNR